MVRSSIGFHVSGVKWGCCKVWKVVWVSYHLNNTGERIIGVGAGVILEYAYTGGDNGWMVWGPAAAIGFGVI